MPAGPAAKGSAIACSGLSKSFGKIEALHDLTLTVPSGVTFGLLGPNGAGKTTSLRLWLGPHAPPARQGPAPRASPPPPPGEARKPVGRGGRGEERASPRPRGLPPPTSLAAALLHDPDLLLLDEPT